MARGKGKRGGGRGTGKRFAAESAEEIEKRNLRLAEFDEKRRKRRADAGADDDDKSGDDESEEENDTANDAYNAEREAMLVGRRVAGMNMDGSDDEGEVKVRKKKGTEGLFETDNPNFAPLKMMKAKDMALANPETMTRKEREEAQKAAGAAAYRRKHEAGLTEEYKRDMAKLAEVKQRREDERLKREAVKQMEEEAAKQQMKKTETTATFGDNKKDEKKKKKKDGKSKIAKLDKISVKKMKPAQLKEALKERGLDIQGNAKALTERLLAYEKER
uniref:SAP domain-containing protein n=1 Tax=Proboscia inermis TaxID=420281 RepID=A0A7S0BVB7_9STRA|mmetsp:Transcript_63630/g.74535  ORF Transcript_63630/g.74535 Transcript_63630/m.74535 type:complete len:275 (+) Transcript_63630:120-944(+)|eukprot:CAMPEP_0171298972 /NCGR_PEP_ID=MMETSP0816-20121228/7754_1 /TAXON_ID=420281 /ORGANISM="Proboscia inermis, Strain CCAP1064/1" /LENGTH=274 /DNA_ID=CAMNT_0011774385 /DNA_START=94 /DNA_END=918 /DNA_ORIENTATION=+